MTTIGPFTVTFNPGETSKTVELGEDVPGNSIIIAPAGAFNTRHSVALAIRAACEVPVTLAFYIQKP